MLCAGTVRNFQLIIEMNITSQAGIAYYVELHHKQE